MRYARCRPALGVAYACVGVLLIGCHSTSGANSEAAPRSNWLGRTAEATGNAVAAPFRWAGSRFVPPAGPTSRAVNPVTYEAPEAVIVPRYPSQSAPAVAPGDTQPGTVPAGQPSTTQGGT